MGKQKMLVNVYEEETRIALTENGVLTGLHFQQTNRERTAGNIYRGTIVKVNPAFQAAFVDYGEKRNGFLSISDLNPALYKSEGKGRSRIQSLLRAGQSVMVQVLKEGLREKGAALTTNLSLPGRYLVYTPNSDRSGVSRKIESTSKRHELKDILTGLVGEEGAGIIIRTAGIDRPALDLKRDLGALKKEWVAIQDRYTRLSRPGLIHQEPGSIVRVLRDYFTDDVEEVWVDSPEAYQESLAYFKSTLPKFQKRLKLYVGELSLFSAHNLEEQIEALGHSRVPLGSGGSIVIESTEALVSIDVNSGRSNQESDIEDTALRTNLEAAKEVARQLRLRNLGGLIVVDFIDMFQAKNRAKVVQTMTESLRYDKARTSIGSISQFGLLELSRQRIDMELSLGLRHRCEACGGTGSVPTLQAYANSLLRKIRGVAATHRYTEVHGELPMEHANYMLNQKRETLRDLEMEFDIKISLIGNPALSPAHEVQLTGRAGGEAGARETGAAEPRVATAPSQGVDAGAGRRRRRRSRGRGRSEDMGPPGIAEQGQVPGVEEEGADTGEQEELDLEEAEGEEPAYVDELEDTGEGVAEENAEVTFAAEPEARPPRPSRDGGREPRHARATSERLEIPPAVEDDEPRQGRLVSPGIPSGQSAAAVQFSSTHRITDPDIEQRADGPRRPVSPFKSVAHAVPAGAELFASAHVDAHGHLVTPGIPMPVASELAEPFESEDYEEAPPAAPAEGEAEEYERDEIEEDLAEEPQDAVAEATPEQEAAVEAAPAEEADRGRRPRRRSRGGRSRVRPSGAVAAVAPEEEPAPGAADDGDAGEDDLSADDNIGNVIAPPAGLRSAAPRRRRRRGGRGRGRTGVAGAAGSAAAGK